MSWQPGNEPDCIARADAIELLIRPHEKDLGGFSVRRTLPSSQRRMVGPYIFFDHMGPARFPAGEGIDVRPHPHIGISTVTWLFDGEIIHRDSLGFEQPIRPGAVNLMTAGRGIVHSERTDPARKKTGATLHGIQLWLALPVALQETAPAFTHYPAEAIPRADGTNPQVTVIIGEAYGVRSPVEALSPTLYAQALFTETGTLALPDRYADRAIYVVEGSVSIGACDIDSGTMAVLRAGEAAEVRAAGPARVMLIGGEPHPEPRSIWWNFVSDSKERIEQAKRDWREGRFDPVPGEDDVIPLPD